MPPPKISVRSLASLPPVHLAVIGYGAHRPAMEELAGRIQGWHCNPVSAPVG